MRIMSVTPAPVEVSGSHPVYFDDLGHAADYAAPHDLAVHFARRDFPQVSTRPITLHYGRHKSEAIGSFQIAIADGAICRIMPDHETGGACDLRVRWPGAILVEDCAVTADYAACIDAYWRGASQGLGNMPVYLAGTDFQLAIWHALLQIPMGACVSYAAVARWVGGPGAARAVGRAVGANPVALLIPCHRVVKSGGRPGNYAWGAARKKDLLAAEAALARAYSF